MKKWCMEFLSSHQARFIRHIYNRVILEIESVRAGAVSALAKIGASVEPLLDSASILLKRCLYDHTLFFSKKNICKW